MKKFKKKYDIPTENLCFITKNFISTGLPMRAIDKNEFHRYNNRVSTCMLAPSDTGLPYGMIPRYAIVAIVTYIVRTDEQIMQIGSSNREHFSALGIKANTSGKIVKYKNQQLNALLNCAFLVTKTDNNGDKKTIRFFIAKENSIDRLENVQSITFSDEFYKYARDRNHVVPLDRYILAIFDRSPLCFDLYITLAYRHYYMRQNQKYYELITYDVLRKQLGLDFNRDADLKRQLRLAIQRIKIFLMMHVYLTDKGMALKCDYPVTK